MPPVSNTHIFLSRYKRSNTKNAVFSTLFEIDLPQTRDKSIKNHRTVKAKIKITNATDIFILPQQQKSCISYPE
jgi:hypothetical protein